MNFGEKLKELRIHKGLTQQQLASQLGITKTVVSYYELHARTPSPDILVKIATIFHVSSDYLLGLENTRTVDVSGLSEDEVNVILNLIEIFRSKK